MDAGMSQEFWKHWACHLRGTGSRWHQALGSGQSVSTLGGPAIVSHFPEPPSVPSRSWANQPERANNSFSVTLNAPTVATESGSWAGRGLCCWWQEAGAAPETAGWPVWRPCSKDNSADSSSHTLQLKHCVVFFPPHLGAGFPKIQEQMGNKEPRWALCNHNKGAGQRLPERKPQKPRLLGW